MLSLNIYYNQYCRYLFGMHAFGLEETNLYREAEKQARKVQFKVVRGYLLERGLPAFLKLIFGMKASTDFCKFWYSK